MENANHFGPGCPWYDMYTQWGAPNLKWCEERLCAWINEPANTWSNIAYFLVAIFILIYTKRNRVRLGYLYGMVVFGMGLASFIFHATNNFFTQMIDFLGMYLFVYLLLTLNFLRMNWIQTKDVYKLFPSLVIGSTLLIPAIRALHAPYQLIVLVAATCILITEVIDDKLWKKRGKRINWKYLRLCIGFFIFAEICSIFDLKRISCDPTNHYFQGHALWHLMGAIGTYFNFLYYQQFLPHVGLKPVDVATE